MAEKHIDEPTGTETTGHEWDGIRELNTPLPRWWLWTFYGTILWAAGYAIAYPAIPLISSATSGLLGYSSRAALDRSLADARAAQAVIVAKLEATPVAEVAADAELARFATAGGASLYKVYCSQCHGTGAEGASGYPNLNDDEWLWGGAVDDIATTITHGVRAADAETRFNLMPNFGTDGLLSGAEIGIVARHVAALAGLEGGIATPEGATLYTSNCAACHSEDGHGVAGSGAPSLADSIWLYGGTITAISAQIEGPRHGMMPAWGARLGDTAIKQLAVYVHSLGGGK